MTRFARAKGSKASNEKTPDDSTPWEVMKEQLLNAKKNNEEAKKWEEVEKQRIDNYEKFLVEHKTQKRKATWCEFPDDTKKPKSNKNTLNEVHSLKSTANVENDKVGDLENPENRQNKKNKKAKKAKHTSKQDTSVNQSISENNVDIKLNSKKKKKNKTPESNAQSETINGDEENPVEQSKLEKTVQKKKKKVPKSTDSFQTTVKDDGSKITNGEASFDNNKTQKQNVKQNKKKKNTKFVDGKPVRRKEINDKSFQLIINGKEVELVRFDGFPIMKKDAQRLEELKTSMMKKGIPKSEVQRTMKLERRRAEKALARMKREVCYNCRKGGHNLSDCPDLKSKIPGVDAAEGVCFKCGSTEHRQFECKVQRDKDFKFATCFICKEAGHIARQCPDNAKGLYPNGGSCKLCGDVTHLRKDCPTVNNTREETNIKLKTIDSMDDVEGIGIQTKNTAPQDSVRKPKKIKF